MTVRSLARGIWRALKLLVATVHSESRTEYERIATVGLAAVGDRVRLTGSVDFGSEPFLISLGSDLIIADGVRFVTHDGGVGILRDRLPDLHVYAPIRVGDRVFIGVGAIILPGVTIGSDIVIGAGSVVTKDIPSNSVAAGVPARVIKTIHEYEEGAAGKGLYWPVGQYGPAWRSELMKRYKC